MEEKKCNGCKGDGVLWKLVLCPKCKGKGMCKSFHKQAKSGKVFRFIG